LLARSLSVHPSTDRGIFFHSLFCNKNKIKKKEKEKETEKEWNNVVVTIVTKCRFHQNDGICSLL
jgi:hypothetical protein